VNSSDAQLPEHVTGDHRDTMSVSTESQEFILVYLRHTSEIEGEQKMHQLLGSSLDVATLLLAALQPSTVIAGVSPPVTNKQAIENMLVAWMGGDPTALQSLLAEDVQWTITGNSVVAGTTNSRPELMSKVLGPLWARFAKADAPLRPRRIAGLYADGDTVIAQFDSAGTANDGKAYANSYLWILTMRHGKIVKGIAFFDSIAVNELWQRVIP
jgi:uncharacterized protein